VIGNLTIQYKAVLCQTVVDGFIAGLPVGGDVLRTPNDPGC
jgi:hypothetical protein